MLEGMKKAKRQGLRTWIEIDTKAIAANYRAFRQLLPREIKMMGVVKSNAYGHNITEFAEVLEKLGIDMLAVDSLVEALALRKARVKTPILVLGYTLPKMLSKAAGKNIHLTISSVGGLRIFLKEPFEKKIPIHLKVDTGMHRQGFLPEDQNQVLAVLSRTKGLRVEGLYTHFAIAKDPQDRKFTRLQLTEFEKWREALAAAGFAPIAHAGATGGALVFPEAHFDMVRVGIGLYGIWPSGETRRAYVAKISLQPVLSWKTLVSEIKEIPKGSSVGYDRTHETARATKIAVCPAGYWHGYPRVLSNNAEVVVCGMRAPILGRVSMDMIVIDVTDVPSIKVGDEVTLIGREGKEEVSADEIAVRAGTSAYEILTRLNPLIKRVYR
ncbi:MAG: Alanine racemase [Parcubacteria group bacterium GW2011_GWA1_47_8]|nr:MAG: Alanine racemase [Parcubacteria group bacterium GW2011_GWA1_47_8]KKW07910.1 MAG: Alanine racemase [Parcubacteria group bacterium GW2011_GWA2_49_16]